MQAKFMHIADCHLGYWQYHLKQRFNDFAQAFVDVMKTAVSQQVDFVLLAGDLFDKRSIDALTLNQAIYGLELLRKADIPCIAVEGNHELAYYKDRLGWMDFLALHDYLILLNPDFDEGQPQITPYAHHEGAYYEPIPGIRVHGLRYLGAATASALEQYAKAMANVSADGVEYTVFMTHAGIEGEVAEQMGGISHSNLAPLRPYVDYVALGHIHKPYDHDDWIYNPGSIETCSISEEQWPKRGCYLVEVDTERPAENGAKHRATMQPVKRRPFYRFPHKMDLHASPDDFYTSIRDKLYRYAQDRDMAGRRLDENPVVEVQLHGVLPFDRTDLDLSAVERIVQEYFHPLHTLVRNLAMPAEYAVEAGESMSRSSLERRVLEELFSRDVRYRGKRRRWSQAAISLKHLTLEGASPQAIVDELAHQMDSIKIAPEMDDEDELVDGTDPVE